MINNVSNKENIVCIGLTIHFLPTQLSYFQFLDIIFKIYIDQFLVQTKPTTFQIKLCMNLPKL